MHEFQAAQHICSICEKDLPATASRACNLALLLHVNNTKPSVSTCVGRVVAAGSFAGAVELEAAFRQQPAAASKALEAAVRGGSALYGQLLSLDCQTFLINMLCSVYKQAAEEDRQQGSRRSSAGPLLPNTSPSPAAAAAGDVAGSPPGGIELFGLLVSSLRFTATYVAKGDRPTEGPLELMQLSVGTLDLLLKMSDLNECNGGRGATCVAHRWLLLAGRAMMCLSSSTRVRVCIFVWCSMIHAPCCPA